MGQIADGRQVRGGAPVGHRHRAGQIALQIAPRVAAGHTQLRYDCFADSGQQIAAGLCHIGKEEFIVLQAFVCPNQLHQLRQAGCPAFKGSHGRRHTAEHRHHPAKLGTGFGIPGIGSLPKHGIFAQLARKALNTLLLRDAAAQSLGGVDFGKSLGKGGKGAHLLLQLCQIGFEGGVLKALVDRVQIPYFIHCVFPP